MPTQKGRHKNNNEGVGGDDGDNDDGCNGNDDDGND